MRIVSGKRWSERDRFGNEIYLTEERWQHITEATNHLEMLACESEVRQTIRMGRRKQDLLNPHKFRYSQAFDNLPADNTHIVAIVLFRLTADDTGTVVPNNYIVTAYQKEVG